MTRLFVAFAGALLLSAPAYAQLGTSILNSGATCDGSGTNDNLINAWLTTSFPNGGLVYIPAGNQCVVNSGNLHVPQNVILVGASSPRNTELAYTLSGNTSSIMLDPSSTISMDPGAQLKDLFIQSMGLVANPSDSQAKTAVAAWGASNSVAITVPSNSQDVLLDDLLIVGFNTAIQTKTGRIALNNIWFDCYNGIDMSNGRDASFVNNTRGVPFYSLGTPTNTGAWVRPGVCFNIHDGDTGLNITNSNCEFFASGMVLANVGGIRVDNTGFEWSANFNDKVVFGAVTGVRFVNKVADVSFANGYSTGFDIDFSDEAVGDVTLLHNSANNASVAQVYLAGGSGIPSTVKFIGTPTVGQVATVSLTSPSITGSPIDFTYTVQADDTVSSVAQAFVSQMRASQPLISSLVYSDSSVAAGLLSIYYPGTATLTASSGVTGSGMTAKSGTGTAHIGSNGILSELIAPDIPAGGAQKIIAGDSSSQGFTRRWTIQAPYFSSSLLPLGWLSAPHGLEPNNIAFSGIPWSAGAVVTSCGTDPFQTGTDAHGAVHVGSGTVNSCTVTFATPFPWNPRAMTLTGRDGTIPLTYTAATTTGFTVTSTSNLAGSILSYSVSP